LGTLPSLFARSLVLICPFTVSGFGVGGVEEIGVVSVGGVLVVSSPVFPVFPSSRSLCFYLVSLFYGFGFGTSFSGVGSSLTGSGSSGLYVLTLLV
jgi:hypothetical protein